MAKVTTEAPKASIVRDPLAMGSGLLTIAGTVLYVLPVFGIKLPDKVTKVTTLLFTVAAALGMRVTVKPA